MRSVGAWRLPLRLAWREARRAPVRSALVLVMIALPVLAVTVADTVYSTARLDGIQGAERRLGAAEARVQLGPTSPVLQLPDPDLGSYQPGADGSEEPVTLARVRRVLGEVPAVEVSRRPVGYVTDAGVGEAELLRTDLTAPLTAGLVELFRRPIAADVPRGRRQRRAARARTGAGRGPDPRRRQHPADRRRRGVGDHVEPPHGLRAARRRGAARRRRPAFLPVRWRPGLLGAGRGAQRDRGDRALSGPCSPTRRRPPRWPRRSGCCWPAPTRRP